MFSVRRVARIIFKSIGLFALFFNDAAAIDLSPKLRLLHSQPEGLITGQRTQLVAQIGSPVGVDVVRCYFKSDQDQQWLFVKAKFAGINRYACELPRFADEVNEVAYRWLVVNKSQQAIRGPELILHSIDQPLFSTVTKRLPLVVFDELWGSYQPAFKDAAVEIKSVTDDTQRFGLLAGIYPASQIPIWFGAYPGYFGGFEYIKVGTTTFAIEGFAFGLAPGHVKSPLLSALSLDLVVSHAAPGIAGNDWSGYFITTGFNNRYNLNANVTQSGGNVDLTTSKTGLAHRFIGTINSSGDMLVYDQYDGEDWTTHYGPASVGSINLYDYVRPPSNNEPNPPLNSVILSRTVIVVPAVPTSISASDGTSNSEILLVWSEVSAATYYLVFRCETTENSTCTQILNTSTRSFADTPPNRHVWWYRVKACNSAGCSAYSAADQGQLRRTNITGPLLLLLLDD